MINKYASTALALFCVVNMGYSQDATVQNLKKEAEKKVTKAEDTEVSWRWKRGGLLNFNVSQGSLSNWAAGGDNFSLAANSYFNYFIYHKNNKISWDNNIDVNFGYVQTTSLGSRKNDDRVDIWSKYGYRVDSLGKKFISTLINLRSQFFDGYTFNNNVPSFSSTILAPAYLIFSVGYDVKPSDKFSMFFSPITSRWTIVANDYLSQRKAYGVDSGNYVINEIGAFATINYNNTFAKNITYKARLDLFSNYKRNPQNVDLFMTNQISFKVHKNLAVTYSLDLIYDDDVKLFGPNKNSPGLQAKSILGIGFLKVLNLKKTP